MESGRGFTLIELLITVTIVAALVLATAPLASNWVARAQTHTGSTVMQEAFSIAKALALKNPNQIASPNPAAGLSISTDGTTTTLLVCTGSAAATTCVTGGSGVQWAGSYSGRVTTTIAAAVNSSSGNTTTTSAAAAVGTPITINFDDRGEALPLTTAYSYTISRGAAGNSEGYALY